MLTVKRCAPAVPLLALLLTACGGTGGDVTITDDAATGAAEPTTATPQAPTPSPESTAQDPSPQPTETPEPEPTPEPEDTQTRSSGDGARETAPATELTIRLDPGTGGEVSEWTVTCDPSGGTIDDPDAACETLENLSPRDVAPVPEDARCTMQYGGPQTATVTGRWDGTKVDLSFSRQDGCEIARWDMMDPVLPAADGAAL